MHNKLEAKLTTSFKFEVRPTTPFMMEKRFNSEFSPNGSWVNWYLGKLLVSSSMTGEMLPETSGNLIYVRNVPFHRPVEVALRLSRIKVFWERVNLGKQISRYDIWQGETNVSNGNNTWEGRSGSHERLQRKV